MNFLTQKNLSSKKILHPKMPYIRERVQDNIERTIEYYQSIFVYPVNNHLIVKLCRILLTQFSIDSLDEIDPYLLRNQLNDFAERNSTMLGIGTDYKNGQLQKVFYDRDYLFFEEIKHEPINEDWTKLDPFVVTSHPRTDISFKVPEPKDADVEDGLSTIKINLYKLLMMFKGYRELELSDEDPSSKYNYKYLLTKYAFPNMLYSHLEVAWFNRMWASFIEYPKAKEIKLVGLTLPTAYTYLDTVSEQTISYFVKGNYNLNDILNNTPALFKESLFDLYEMKDSKTTNTARAYYLLSRYRMLAYLIDLVEGNPPASKVWLMNLVKYLRSCVSYDVFSNINILLTEEDEINVEVIVPLINLGYGLKTF